MRSHLREPLPLFPGSSAVEQPAVNRLVAGSNPARGAKLNQRVTLTFAQITTSHKPVWGSIQGSK
jgi:hypothetical protein